MGGRQESLGDVGGGRPSAGPAIERMSALSSGMSLPLGQWPLAGSGRTIC